MEGPPHRQLHHSAPQQILPPPHELAGRLQSPGEPASREPRIQLPPFPMPTNGQPQPGASAMSVPPPQQQQQQHQHRQQSASVVQQYLNPPSTSVRANDGRSYMLEVVQQPQRARMCGFGDKDRRPITPPPCVRVIIVDSESGKEIDINSIDHSMFVLNVDLWSFDGTREVNLVRHATPSPSPSISNGGTPYAAMGESATVTPYGTPMPPSREQYGNPYAPQQNGSHNSYNNSYQGQTSSYPSPQPQHQHQQGPPNYPMQHYQQHSPHQQTQSHNGYSSAPPTPTYTSPQYPENGSHHNGYYGNGQSGHPQNGPPMPRANGDYAQPAQRLTGMFTRNLIGSLAASAFRLTDPHDKIGIWFVLQDLSVRTEGSFRLRFSFVNVGIPSPQRVAAAAAAATATGTPGSTPAAAAATGSEPAATSTSSVVTTGKAPVLASCFSDVFVVYSAKKFPGVVESTSLSKCFATQGIKIPIRKEGQPTRNRDEYDDDQ